MGLLHLEVRNAIAQQAPNTVVLFKDRDFMACPCELLGGGEACRPRADHGHFLTGLVCGRLRHDPALLPAPVDDRVLNRLDAYRIIVEI